MSAGPFRERRRLPRLRAPEPAALAERFFDPGLPFVIEGFHHLGHLARWMGLLESSRAVVPCVVARDLNVAKISDADRPPIARAAELPEVREFSVDLPLAEAWARIRRPDRHQPLLVRGECLYVIEGLVPEDCPFPPQRDSTALAARLYSDPRTPLVIVNMPGMINRNHAHVHEVLLHQVHGRKKVRLFSPADGSRLYANADRRSQVPDFDRVDLGRFPQVAETTAHETVLEPGDVIFLPSYWWHEIRVDEPAVSVAYTIEAGAWARRMFALHHALAEALAPLETGDAEATGRGAGAAALVTATTAALLGEEGLAPTVAALRYEYTD